MKKIPILITIVLLILTSCKVTLDDPNEEDDADKPSNHALYSDMYDSLFSLDKKITIKINIDKSELMKINNDYINYSQQGQKSDIYRYAKSIEVIIDGDIYEIPHVGIRMKGNTSLRTFMNENNEIYNLIHFRLSFKQTFDSNEVDILGNKVYSNPMNWSKDELDALKKRTVFGLEALEMKYNKEIDSTYSREIYTSELFKTNGIYAQKMNVAKIVVANSSNCEGSLGLYRIAEVVDEIFINRHFDKNNQGGDLYKCGWGNYGAANFTYNTSAYGIETTEYVPSYDLKTNKKSSTHKMLKNLLSLLSYSVSYIDIRLSEYFDEEYLMTLFAIYFITGDPDSLMYNDNNFYIYFSPNDKAYIIPYDYERTFGAKATWNPFNSSISISPKNFINCRYENTSNQLVIKTIKDNQRLQNIYLEKINEISTTYFYSFNSFKTYYDKIYQINSTSTHVKIDLIDYDIPMRLSETNNTDTTGENYSVESYFNNKQLS